MVDWKGVLSFIKISNLTEDEKNFKPYKSEDGEEIPNNAIFTGDKFPKSGDPAKIELNDWHKEDNQSKKDRDIEHKAGPGSVIAWEGISKEFKREASKRNWRTVLADVSFKQKPDGFIQIDVNYPSDTAPTQEEYQWESNNSKQSEGSENEQSETPQSTQKSKNQQKADLQYWVIRKHGNLELVGGKSDRECSVKIVKNGTIVDDFKVNREGRDWRELINQSVWEARFDSLL